MADFSTFGDGTITLGSTPVDFSCEVLGGKVTHVYEDVGESRTMLCGIERAASKKRTDGLSFSLENDLTGTGLYSYLMANDLTDVPFVFTPNTADAASWAGTVQLTLPSEIGADEYGAPIVSAVEWAGVGAFTYTAATTTTTLSADQEADAA